MAELYVDACVSLQCRVNEKPDRINRPLQEGKQKHDQWDCRTGTISECEWNWRFETAKKILCAGTAETTGNYTGDVIGGYWDCDTKIVTNESKFNER